MTWKPFNCRININTTGIINVVRRDCRETGNIRAGISVTTAARTCRVLAFRSNNKIISDTFINSC